MLKTCLGWTLGVVAFAMAAPAAAATINVTTTQDNPAVDGLCSLREAIVASNLASTIDTCVASAGGNTIVLGAATYSFKPSLGAIGVISSIAIVGAGHKQTFIQQDPSELLTSPSLFLVNVGHLDVTSMHFTKFRGRVLTVNTGASASVYYSKFSDNGGNFTSSGGCIQNFGTIVISDSEVAGCQGTTGAGLQNVGTAVVEYSTFMRNRGERGGAIYNQTGATLYVTSSTIGRNESTRAGSAIQNGGNAYITSSTIAYNLTDLDGAVSCTSPLTCSALQNFSGGYVELSGSVVAHNTASSMQTQPNCIGSPRSTGGNLLGEAAATACSVVTLPGALSNLSPQSAQLLELIGDPQANGGVGRTYLPKATSPLLNQLPGSSGPCGFPDQRGIDRWSRPCDIGAFERAPALLVVGNLTLSSGDNSLKFILENLGYSVTVELSTSTTAASANGKAVVVISESVTSTDVNTKFRDVSAGVLVLESALFDDMRMTGTTNNTHYGVSNETGIVLKSGQITSRYGALGALTTTSSSVSHSWGVPDVNSDRQGTINSSSSRYGLFAYFPGNAMVPSTHVAGAYRVGAFATDAAMAMLTSNATDLLKEAVLFASK